ncbi:MAG: hypothetical protein WCB68_07045, partial [Pyrinomonadaceae bacterium]
LASFHDRCGSDSASSSRSLRLSLLYIDAHRRDAEFTQRQAQSFQSFSALVSALPLRLCGEHQLTGRSTAT